MDLAAALIVSRFLHFSAAMLLFGAAGFCGLLAPKGFGVQLSDRLRWPEAVLAWLVFVTAIAWLCCETGEIGNGWTDAGNPATIWKVLSATSFGTAWSVHLVLVLLPLLALLIAGRRGQQGLAVSSALVLMSLGFVGHAADQQGLLGLFHRLNHAVHLLSSGFWVGSLPPLLVVLLMLRNPETRIAAGTALRRFSSLGHVAVALALLTGVVNTLLIVGGLPVDFAVPYQRLLSIKIALVVLMMAIAIVNRYVTVPRLFKGPTAFRGLVAGTIAEIVIGAAVIALVSAFATFDPMGMDMSGMS